MSRTLIPLLMVMLLCIGQVVAQSPVNGDFRVNNIAVSGDHQRFAISGRYESLPDSDEGIDHIDVYDTATLQRLYAIPVNPSPALLISLNHDGTKVAFSTRLGNVVIHDLDTGHEIQPVGGGYADVGKLAWSPVEDKLASSGRADINIENNGTRAVSMIDSAGIGHISSMEWSNDGKVLASTDYNPSKVKAVLQFWDLSGSMDTFQIFDTPKLRIPDAGGSSLSWDATNQMIAAKQADGLYVYDVATGKEIAFLNQNNLLIDGSGPIEWIPNTTQIIGADSEGIYQWDYMNGTLSRIYMTAPITQLIWTPRGILHNGGGRGLYINDQALGDIDLKSIPTAIGNDKS